jgi:hypothetical protein
MPQPPRLAEDVEFQSLGDGYLVNLRGSDQAHVLNRTAMLIILQCDGATTPDAIARSLQELHALDTPPIADVTAILAQMEAQGVVERPAGAQHAAGGTKRSTKLREPIHA